MNNIINTIKNLYNKEGFFQKYGSQLILSLFIIYIFIAISFYFYILNHLPSVKANWSKNRCNPIYMPYAGFVINDPKKTHLKQIEDNFSQCTQNILVSIINTALDPIYFAITLIGVSFETLLGVLNGIREVYDRIREDLAGITDDIEKKSLVGNAPILRQTVLMKNSLNLSIGVLSASLYELFGTYFTLKSFGGSIIQIINELILIPMAASIAILYLLPLTLLQAIALTVVYLSIMIPLLVIELTLHETLQVPITNIEGP